MDAPFNFPTGMRLKKFEVYGKGSTINDYGRVAKTDDTTLKGYVYGTLSSTSENQQYRFKGIEHPVSHTLVVQSNFAVSQTTFGAEDILVSESGDKYEVQGVTNPSELPFFYIAYLNKR